MSDSLWAPWRIGYITAVNKIKSDAAYLPKQNATLLLGADSGCFLCRGAGQAKDKAEPEYDRENMVVIKTAISIAMLNRYPYNNGHLLIAPRRHVARLDTLTDEENLDAVKLIAQLTGVLEQLMNPEGFNIGLNLGKVAGAGLPGHLHWHIVPRWNGDTNFMPVLAGVNVIPQSLEALYDLLSGELKSK